MKTPITIITGYLGSGKTTLLRNILEQADRKFAIVMNEFGDIGIDQKIIKGKNVDIAELSGGCVCCSLTGELEYAIKEILEKTSPDWIVLETTGTAEPDAILVNINDFPGVRLDSVITIVDADAMVRFPSLGHIGEVQIEMGDIILINKKDLVSREQLSEVVGGVKEINPRAAIFETEKCRIDTALLFGIGAEKKEAGKKPPRQKGIDCFAFSTGKLLDRKKFEAFIKRLPAGIYRAKGFVRFSGGSFLFNYVGGRADFEEFDADKTELVFLGTSLDKEKTRKELEKCI
jgi:G3E family GTPase